MFGLITDFNGVDINHAKKYIKMACPDYIDCNVVSHNWQDEPDIGNPGD